MAVNILGTNLDGIFGEIQARTKDLFAGVSPDQQRDLFGEAQPAGRRDVWQGTGQGADDPFAGIKYEMGGALGNFAANARDPFAGLSYNANANPIFALAGAAGLDKVFGQFASAKFAKETKDTKEEAAAQAAAAKSQAQTVGSTVGGGGYLGSGTQSDNKGLTAEKIDQFIASKFANSPLRGQGAYILAMANQYGIAVPVLLGIAWKESGMGTNVGAGNIFGITDPSRDQGLGGQRAFQTYAGAQAEIEAAARLLATDIYKGKSVEQQIGSWYVGPQEFAANGLNATDRAGNGTVGQYLDNFIKPAYAGLGLGYNPAAVPTRAVGSGGSYHGAGGLPSLTGGSGSIGQEFGDTDYSAGNPIYDYGHGSGVSGHTGIDWAVPPGTQVYMPAGLSGTVITSGGTAFFRDEDENPAGVSPPGQGELKIRLSNGMELILGHMRSISVPVGTQLSAGQLVGLAGSANGGHIHVELRVTDPSLPNGYRIIDPRTILGGGATGAGQQNY